MEAKERSLFCERGQDLLNAGTLVDLVTTHLTNFPNSSFDISMDLDGETYNATRLDLQGFKTVDIYRQHLSDIICQNFMPAVPNMTVFCDKTSTDSTIKDILLVAGISGLCRVVHLVGVDRLTPRIREVYFLEELNYTNLELNFYLFKHILFY